MSNRGSTEVTTKNGKVSGRPHEGCFSWRGLPFAAAPIGPRRWRAPEKVIPWQGVRDATKFGFACPQTISAVLRARGGVSEDCLHLNVWSPAADGKRRPVLVWIHGGGFVAGSSNLFDGAHFAVGGDVVVVTVNYRLGILGLVNLASVTDASKGSVDGNLGLRDQIAALEWVRDNIEDFGGDPTRVTIVGESAGSICCALLLASKAARPLFSGAILQSGALNLVHDAESSRFVASQYRTELPLDRGVDHLRSLSVETLLRAQRAVDSRLPGMVPAAPWFDGDLLPSSFEETLATPWANVPILIGTCRNEFGLFELVPGWKPIPTTRSDLADLVQTQLGADAAKAIQSVYPETRAGNQAFGTDATFRAGAWQLAEKHAAQSPTWLYRFDARNPVFGALHGIDVTYIWNTKGAVAALFRGGALTGRRAALATRLHTQWIRFVRDGQPGEDWCPFGGGGGGNASFATKTFDFQGDKDRVLRDPDAAQRAAWNGQSIQLGKYRPKSAR